jgi:saccharopine dehydrogenase-like NADP-dependent oxidoreductase
MQRVAVLGAGRVGYAIACDLSTKFAVSAYDIDTRILNELNGSINTEIHQVDLNKADFNNLFNGIDLVISAVPGFMGYNTLRRIIQASKNVVDISFFPEDPFGLDDLARSQGVCAVIDCGVAPGMGNIILGRYNEIMKVDSYECLVGGLPIERKWPFQYKAGFSPIDVIEEYIRPARFVRNGKMVTREALSDPELVYFEKVGSLESFNTDGLRTLINTMNIPDMIEKTLRYPGSIEYLKVLRDSGFFSYDPVVVDGHKIRPVDFTSNILFPLWKLEKGEADITVMRITIQGETEGSRQNIVYHLYDEHDKTKKISSMARTTGYTCTAVANLILKRSYHTPGINPPEYLGRSAEHFDFIMDYLKKRNVRYVKDQKKSY